MPIRAPLVLILALNLAASDVELKVGTSAENREIQGEATSFTVAADTKLWAWTRVSKVGKAIQIVFEKGGDVVFSQELNVPRSPHRTRACRTFRAGDSGTWVAKVIDSDGKERAKVTFTVKVEG